MAEASISIMHRWLPLEDGRIEGEELEATFGRLRIDIAGRTITRTHRRDKGTVTLSLKIPLYPLAEWLVRNWFYLFHEEGSSNKKRDPDFFLRHDLSTGREGYAFPSLYIAPFGSDVLYLEWNGGGTNYNELEFLAEGHAYIPVKAFQEEAEDLVASIVERLREKGLFEVPLIEEWEILQRLSPEEREFCELAATAGIDPFDPGEHEEWFFKAKKELPEAILHPLFNCMDPNKVGEELRTSLRTIDQLKEKTGISGLKEIRNELHGQKNFVGQNPIRGWDRGYDLAGITRDIMGLNGQPIGGKEGLKELIGLDEKEEDNGFIYEEGFPRDLIGIGGVSQAEEASFAFPEKVRRNEERWNFVFCRALFEYLKNNLSDPYLVADLYDSDQQANRAFAAEFLAPASGIQKELQGKEVITEADISEIAALFHVSTYVIEHQVQNHGIAKIEREDDPC